MPGRKRSAKSAKEASKATESCSSEEDDDWEEVEENNLETSVVDIKDDVEIEFDLPDVVKKQQKKKQQIKEWLEMLVKRAYNKGKKEVHIRMHQTHLLCLLCVGMQTNNICNDVELQSIALSVLPVEYIDLLPKKISIDKVTRLMQWINSSYSGKELTHKGPQNLPSRKKSLSIAFGGEKVTDTFDLVLLHLVVYRCMGIHSRLVMSFQPMSYKPPTAKQIAEKAEKLKQLMDKVKKASEKKLPPSVEPLQIPQVDGANDTNHKPRRSTRQSTATKMAKNKQDIKKCSAKESGIPKVVKSKYKFAGKHESCTDDKMDEDVYTDKAEKTNPRLRKRDLSPAKKISKILKSEARSEKQKEIKPKKKENKIEETSPTLVVPLVCSFPVLISEKDKVKLENESNNGTSRLQTRRKNIATKKEESTTSDYMESESSPSDDDFVEPRPKRLSKSPPTKNKTFTKVLPKRPKQQTHAKSKPPTKHMKNSRNETAQNEWLEVYIPKTGWIHVDCVNGQVNDPKSAEARATHPLHYVIAFDDDSCVKDVTARYASGWLTTTRKLRIGYVEPDWWNDTLKLYKTKKRAMDNEENKQLESDLLAQPLPVSIAAYKNHPLFAIRRHLLKYESIYPPDTPAVGFVRGEEIFPRSCVHVLHTREKWLQQALSVRDGEEPYKMVASYLLNKKLNRDSDTPSLPLFGKWQTENFRPAVAKDGKVPRNEYGNVDLFQPSMLPIGCVHLRLAGLHTVARKLNIDVSVAIVGFDTHSGYPHPVLDGYVACKEHEQILQTAWEEDQVHAAERAKEKREQKIYTRWKKLIRGITALERVRRKYESGNSDEDQSKNLINGGTNWQTEKLEEIKNEEKGKRTRRGGKKKRKEEQLPFEIETM